MIIHHDKLTTIKKRKDRKVKKPDLFGKKTFFNRKLFFEVSTENSFFKKCPRSYSPKKLSRRSYSISSSSSSI